LNLVPDEQVLGLYVLYNHRSNKNELSGVTPTGYCGAANCTRNSFNLGLVGVGMRYFPSQKMFADASAMKSTGAPTVGKYNAIPLDVLVTSIRGLLGYRFGLAARSSLYAGIGVTGYSISQDASTNYVTPTVQVRLEYRAQSRMGISAAVGYDLQNKVASSLGDDWAVFNKFYIEPSVSFYF